MIWGGGLNISIGYDDDNLWVWFNIDIAYDYHNIMGCLKIVRGSLSGCISLVLSVMLRCYCTYVIIMKDLNLTHIDHQEGNVTFFDGCLLW
jgi:hypothetical protein